MTAITVDHLSKVYHLYDSPQARLKEALHPLRRKYHHDFYALNDVSFSVEQGEVLGIIGKNGCGKSTLLKILAGVLTPTSGAVTVNGNVSALLELGGGFNPEFTGLENVYFSSAIMGYSRDQVEKNLDSIIAFADIGEFIHQPVKTYSSGMYVRLAFAVAINVDPDVLIIDEALAVGDIAFQQKCLDRIRELKERDITIILVSHDIMMVRNYCDVAMYLEKGGIKLLADPETAGECFIKEMFSEKQAVGSSDGIMWKKNTLPNQEQAIRFGNTLGEVTSVHLYNPRNNTNVFNEGDELVVRLEAQVNRSITFPALVVQIRDYKGTIIYGTKSQPENLLLISHDEVVNICAQLSLSVYLFQGQYSLTISLNNAPSMSTTTILDKIVGISPFTVNPTQNQFHGLVNLHATWGTDLPPSSFLTNSDLGIYDIGAERLSLAMQRSSVPELLATLVNLSRHYFHWFTKRFTRTDEYAWIADILKNVTGKIILDIGTGVSPLPIFLAQKSNTVITIDYNEEQRILGQNQAQWNGWGFLDYNTINPQIVSFNIDVQQAHFDVNRFAYIYSVSVVEHMSAQVRSRLWSKLYQWCQPEGKLLLTVDLYPGTENLWNFNEGQQIEDISLHGDLQQLIHEIQQAGFQLIVTNVLRNYPDTPPTDVAFLQFEKNDHEK